MDFGKHLGVLFLLSFVVYSFSFFASKSLEHAAIKHWNSRTLCRTQLHEPNMVCAGQRADRGRERVRQSQRSVGPLRAPLCAVVIKARISNFHSISARSVARQSARKLDAAVRWLVICATRAVEFHS